MEKSAILLSAFALCAGCVNHPTGMENYPANQIGYVIDNPQLNHTPIYAVTIEGRHYYAALSNGWFCLGPEIPKDSWSLISKRVWKADETEAFIKLPESE